MTINKTIKANNKKYNLQFKPTPILNGEYELDSEYGKLIGKYATLEPFYNQRFFLNAFDFLNNTIDEQDETIEYVKRIYK